MVISRAIQVLCVHVYSQCLPRTMLSVVYLYLATRISVKLSVKHHTGTLVPLSSRKQDHQKQSVDGMVKPSLVSLNGEAVHNLCAKHVAKFWA